MDSLDHLLNMMVDDRDNRMKKVVVLLFSVHSVLLHSRRKKKR